ncbi:MAG: hypothetical protein VYE00_13220 [Candidatus Poribacteria bacterium]|nr:hypothetical protein [Candidatus Poribacteria bacterium]
MGPSPKYIYRNGGDEQQIISGISTSVFMHLMSIILSSIQQPRHW